MNAKLKNVLHAAWNEPRRFFFWLALCSFLGFVVTGVGSVHRGPSLLLAFVALCCILGFVLGLPAFVLAWIPPVRRLLARLLGQRFLVLACLATLIALFYAVEDWRGRRAWQQFQRDGEAKGERFDSASYIPGPAPDDQNFFATPLWEDLRRATTNSGPEWKAAEMEGKEEEGIFGIYGPQGQRVPSAGRWAKAQPVDLAAWQGFYRGDSNKVSVVAAADQAALEVFRRRYGISASAGPSSGTTLTARASSPPTNYFPVAKEPQAPADDVLLALSRFDGNRQVLIASAARPQARFWVNYDVGVAAPLPHLGRIKAAAQYLSLHACAALKAGDPAAALEDLKLAYRLLESTRGEPFLISQLVRMAELQLALQPVWEGLAERQWTATDLAVIEGDLSKLDFLADYRTVMLGERTRCWLWVVDYLHKAGPRGLDELAGGGGDSGSADFGQSLGLALSRLIPSGWYDQNKASLGRLTEACVLPVVDLRRRIVSPNTAQQSESALESLRPRPYDALSKLLMPAVARVGERFAYAQTSADLAQVACALERYRLAQGQFPEALDALVPRFIEPLPHDVTNGEPLKYRRSDDGQFVLYSVGWNGTDDGGSVGPNKSGKPDMNNPDMNTGDWVWRYPAR